MNVAFIPVRGGSKSIPLKNIKMINGKPLVYWTVKAAASCKYIDEVYVSTDSNLINETIKNFNLPKVNVINRSLETATDTATTESAMIEFANRYDFDNIVLIQATSPLLQSIDLEGGFNLLKKQECDSVLSVVKQYRFIWNYLDNGNVMPQNYDLYNRPRRQDFSGFLMENGAFYITSKEKLINSNNRISGRILPYEMSEDTAYEIDEPNDWIIVEKLLKNRDIKAVENKKHIKMLLTDCDGCLTDGGMYYSNKGDELKKFNAKDGMAFYLLRKKGIVTGIVTGENIDLNRRRAEKLKVDELHMGIEDKLTVIRRIAKKRNIDMSQIAYIGDDINDLDVLKEVGFSCCPRDAVSAVRAIVDFVTESPGGTGVIREVVDKFI